MLRLSLRWRVAVAFGLSSLLVASLFAVVTWQLASDYMLRQREKTVTAQAAANVRLVEGALRVGSEGLNELLTGLGGEPRSTILLHRQGSWITSGRQVDPAVLPAQLLALAREGTPARQRLIVGKIPVLAVALPIAADNGIYVQLSPLVELDRSFRFLSRLLVASTALSALLGVALGWWTSQRALRPLTELTAAAARVAQGDLQARLPEQSDPDLAPLAVTFNATATALEQRVRRDARFAGDVSHELRSPLTTMVNASEVLQRRRAELPATARKAADLLANEVQRFRHMVVICLNLPPRSGRGRPGIGGSRSGCWCATSRPAAPVTCRSTSVSHHHWSWPIGAVSTTSLPTCSTTPNATVAALFGSPSRGETIACAWRSTTLAPACRSSCVSGFSSGSPAGHRSDDDGSGLGLAVVAQHVSVHSGAVWVEDSPSGGARFVVELPELPR